MDYGDIEIVTQYDVEFNLEPETPIISDNGSTPNTPTR